MLSLSCNRRLRKCHLPLSSNMGPNLTFTCYPQHREARDGSPTDVCWKSERVRRRRGKDLRHRGPEAARDYRLTELQGLGIPGFGNHGFSESLELKAFVFVWSHLPATHRPQPQPPHLIAPQPWIPGFSGGRGGVQPQAAHAPGALPAHSSLRWLLPGAAQPPEDRLVLLSRWRAASGHKPLTHLS